MGKTPDYSKHTLYKKVKRLDETVGDEILPGPNHYFRTDQYGNKGWLTTEEKFVWDKELQAYIAQEGE